nr:MAG TPA: hypothetical protein [Caudoviricetes sp.]
MCGSLRATFWICWVSLTRTPAPLRCAPGIVPASTTPWKITAFCCPGRGASG